MKLEEEKALAAFMDSNPEMKKKYGKVLDEIGAQYAAYREYADLTYYLSSMTYTPVMVRSGEHDLQMGEGAREDERSRSRTRVPGPRRAQAQEESRNRRSPVLREDGEEGPRALPLEVSRAARRPEARGARARGRRAKRGDDAAARDRPVHRQALRGHEGHEQGRADEDVRDDA